MSEADLAAIAPPPGLGERAARIRLLALDVDGTLTDGGLGFNSLGVDHKQFHVHDGQGLRLAQDAGIAIALITARNSPIVDLRARELGIAHVVQGSKDKGASLSALCARLGIAAEQAAFMGDDLPDLAAMAIAGLAIAPANAHPWVRARTHWVTRAEGGRGAVREVCDGLLHAQGKAQALIAGLPRP